MKLTDEAIRQAMARRLSALDDHSPYRRARILQTVTSKEEPTVKKTLSIGFVIAIGLIIAYIATALALSGNLFHFFGAQDARYDKVAGQAALETTQPLVVPGAQAGIMTDARIDSALYDGMTLHVALSITNHELAEAYTPSGDELSAMEILPAYLVQAIEDGASAKAQAQKDMLEAMRSGTPRGYRLVIYRLSDHVLTDDGTDIPPYAASVACDENGRYVEMREFASPLPEELQNKDALTLNCAVHRSETLWYYDGATLYHKHASGEVGVIRATVMKSVGMITRLRGEAETAAGGIQAAARATALNAVVTISGTDGVTLRDLLDKSARPPEGLDASDVWVSMTACDEQGRAYRATEGFSQDRPLPITLTFLGVGEPPQWLDVRIRLEWEGETENNIAPFVIRLHADEQDW